MSVQDFGGGQIYVQIRVVPLTRGKTVGKLSNLSVFPFYHQKHGTNNTYILWL